MTLKQVSSTELNLHTGAILRQAQVEPVTIMDQGEPIVMMLSHRQYQAMGGECSHLLNQLEKNHHQAKVNGLTEETLYQLLYEKK